MSNVRCACCVLFKLFAPAMSFANTVQANQYSRPRPSSEFRVPVQHSFSGPLAMSQTVSEPAAAGCNPATPAVVDDVPVATTPTPDSASTAAPTSVAVDDSVACDDSDSASAAGAGASVSGRDSELRGRLMCSVFTQDMEEFVKCVTDCADDRMMSEVLNDVASNGSADMCVLLTERGVRHTPDAGGLYPLHHAIARGDAAVFTALLNPPEMARVYVRDHKCSRGETLLMHAITERLEFANALLLHGASVTDCSHAGATCLHFAAARNDAKLCAALIARGADVHVRMKDGVTPLHRARGYAATKMLLDHGAKVDVVDDQGYTPLHWAQGKKISLLLEHGAEVNARDEKGNAPIHFIWTVKELGALVAAGADVNAENNKKWTPLHFEARSGNAELYTALIKAGAKGCANEDGLTPLHMCAGAFGNSFSRTPSRMDEFFSLMSVTDAFAKDSRGRTALHYAVESGAIEGCRALATSHPKLVDEVDLQGQTPLHIAATHSAQAYELFLKLGGSQIPDAKGTTPAQIMEDSNWGRCLPRNTAKRSRGTDDDDEDLVSGSGRV